MVNVYTQLYSRVSDNDKANKDTGTPLTALGWNHIQILTYLTCRFLFINDSTAYIFWHENDTYTKLDPGGII